MPKAAKSEAARYVDQLEKLVIGTRPLAGWHFSIWHALLGGFTGLLLGFWLGLMASRDGDLLLRWLLTGSICGVLLFAIVGRSLWNRVLLELPKVREIARRNLLEHELLLLAM